MIRTSEKIILVVFVTILIGINSFFITALEANNSTDQSKRSYSNIVVSASVTEEADDEDEEDEEISFEELEIIDGLITEERAKQIALTRIGKGTVTDFESEREGGRILYEVRITDDGNEVEVEINAQTGQVLEVEWEDEEDDD